ncbi:MAG: hypothetical protein VYA11_03305 [Planctomycetota bacterium]|nr:hypothetical protein [Planctomycetota bacterium]
MDPLTPEASALAPGMHDIGGEVTTASTIEMSAAEKLKRDILLMIRQRLQRSVYIAIRGVETDFEDGMLYFRGTMPTFYTKQVLLSLAEDLGEFGVEKVVDETVVMKH